MNFLKKYGPALSALALVTGCATTSPVNPAPAANQTLPEYVNQTSQALLKPGSGENWKPDTARAHEIQAHRSELSMLVEDAGWIIALADALNGPLPDDLKNKLRRLHENYASDASHPLIAKQVEELLPQIHEDRLRKELKKLANRSWDRDRKNGKRGTDSSVRASGRDPQKLRLVQPESSSVRAVREPPQPVTADTSIEQTKNRVDSLMAQGHYLAALRILEMIEDKAGVIWVSQHRKNLGNRYCEEHRAAAAVAFMAARKAKKDSDRIQSLRQSRAELDSCLYLFPDSPLSEKVRRNRALVEKELGR